MKNYKCNIKWNSHCNKEDIEDMIKKFKQFIKLSFFNVTNLECDYKEDKPKKEIEWEKEKKQYQDIMDIGVQSRKNEYLKRYGK